VAHSMTIPSVGRIFIVGLAVIAAVLVAGSGLAQAESPPPLVVTPTHVIPGGVIRVSGSDCRPPTTGPGGGSGPPQVVLDAPRKVVVQGRHAPQPAVYGLLCFTSPQMSDRASTS